MPKYKKDFGASSGKCEVCTINLWENYNNKPVIWPCNIKGCPYEDPKKQNQHDHRIAVSRQIDYI